jgi:hypothetical protein
LHLSASIIDGVGPSPERLREDSTNRVSDIIKIHNKSIIKSVPKEKLLVMRLQNGWKPLCEFLGKPIPEEPFPRVNDSDALDQTVAYVMGKSLLRWIALLITVTVVPYVAYRFSKQSA